MATAKLFQNGQSQAVRLPKEFRFDGDNVEIRKLGDIVYLFSPEKTLEIFLQGVKEFDEDFELERADNLPERDIIL